jgi:hypothetical protein
MASREGGSARSGSASPQSSEIDGVHWHFVFVPKRIPMRTDMSQLIKHDASRVQAVRRRPAIPSPNSLLMMSLAHQLAVMHDTDKQACEHEADCDLGIDAGTTIVEAIQVGDFIPQPRKVENTIDAHEHMVIRNECRSEPVMSSSS